MITTVEKSESVDYSLITEAPGLKATHEQVERLYQRYRFARQFAEDKDVFEVACGSGIGLGYLARVARKVVGCDVDKTNLNLANKHYQDSSNLEIIFMDAHDLSFPKNSFDLALLYEAIYYLRGPEKFVSEAARLLRENGVLIVCIVNKDWEDFHPSPYTHKYFSVPELYELLKVKFVDVEIFGGFSVKKQGVRAEVVSLIKRFAVNFNLIPGSLKTRAYLKRVFMGKLVPLPSEVFEDMAPYEAPVEICASKASKDYKIIYAVARRPK